MSKTSFHGTGISIFQHTNADNKGELYGPILLGAKPNSKRVPNLSETYTNMKPAFLKIKPVPPKFQTPLQVESQYCI